MEYTLTELEHKGLMPRAVHDEDCKAYQDQLKELKARAHKLWSQYNAQHPEKAGQSETRQLTALLDDLSSYAKKTILYLVEKQGGIINDIGICTIYCGKGNEVHEGMIASVESSGKITLEDGPVISLDKLSPDALQVLYGVIYKENTNESK